MKSLKPKELVGLLAVGKILRKLRAEDVHPLSIPSGHRGVDGELQEVPDLQESRELNSMLAEQARRTRSLPGCPPRQPITC